MPVNRVLAGLAVADVDAALLWYERLFGRPADALPMEGLAEWHVPSGGVVQLIASAERAGQIVGVPAGVPHRWVATGDSRLRAIAVHGAAEIVTSPACAGAPRRASR